MQHFITFLTATWLASTFACVSATSAAPRPTDKSAVPRTTEALLESLTEAESFAALSGQEQTQIRKDTAAVYGALERGVLGEMPSFVSTLIQGTFDAMVDASIQQMKAYGELLQSVSKTVDEFGRDDTADASERQQVLATMVMMGINRIVVTNGELSPKLVFVIDRDGVVRTIKRRPSSRSNDD